MCVCICSNTHTCMAIWYNIVFNHKKLGAECLLIEVWINKLWHFHAREYYAF